MARYPHQRGEQTGIFEQRYARGDTQPCSGVNTEATPANIPPHQFITLLNARWEGDSVRPRGGMFQATPDLNGSSHPHQTFDSGTPKRIYMTMIGCPTIDPSGRSISFYDENEVPVGGTAAWYRSVVDDFSLALFAGQPHVSVDPQLRKFLILSKQFGDQLLVDSGTDVDIPIAEIGGTFAIAQMLEFDSQLYLFCWDTTMSKYTGTGRIFAWDGVSLRLDLDGIATVQAAIVLNRDLMFTIHNDGSVRYRSRGFSPGTWTVVAGAGTIPSGPSGGISAGNDIVTWGPNSITTFLGDVYITSPSKSGSGDFSANIWKITATTVTKVNDIPPVAPAGSVTRSRTILGIPRVGLYYGWGQVDTPFSPDEDVHEAHPKIGFSTDGVSFTDNQCDLETQTGQIPPGPQNNYLPIDALLYYRNRLVAIQGGFVQVPDTLIVISTTTFRLLTAVALDFANTRALTSLVF